MGASDVIATNEQVNTALNAMLTQLGASGIAKNYDSLSHAIEELDLWDFLDNQARVTAQLHAFAVRDTKIIQNLTFAGAFEDE